jgi:hypothetical protein
MISTRREQSTSTTAKRRGHQKARVRPCAPNRPTVPLPRSARPHSSRGTATERQPDCSRTARSRSKATPLRGATKSFRKPLPMQRHFVFCNMALLPGHRHLPHTYHLSSCVRESGPNIKPSSSSACVRIQHYSRRSGCTSVPALADGPLPYHLSSCACDSGPNFKPSSSSACVRIQHCSRRSRCTSVSAFADFITAFSLSGIMRVIE